MAQRNNLKLTNYGIDRCHAPFAEKALEELKEENPDKAGVYENMYYEQKNSVNSIVAPAAPAYKKHVAEVLAKANELYMDSEGFAKATVSMAIDARVDVSFWIKKDASKEEIEKKAKEEFADADLTNLDVIGTKPVNYSMPDVNREGDF